MQQHAIFLSIPIDPDRLLIGPTNRLRRHDDLLPTAAAAAADGGIQEQELTAELVAMLDAA